MSGFHWVRALESPEERIDGRKYFCYRCGNRTRQKPYAAATTKLEIRYFPSCCMNDDCLTEWRSWILIEPNEDEQRIAEVNQARDTINKYLDERDGPE